MEQEEQIRADIRRKDDLADSIIARRESADILSEVNDILKKVERKLKYRKSSDVSLKLFRLIQELNEIREILEDPESDPD